MFLFEMTQHLFFTVITGSLITLAIIGVLLILGIIYACVMEWADDNEKDYNNPMWSFLLKVWGQYRIKNIPIEVDFTMKYWKGGVDNKKYEGCSYRDLSQDIKDDVNVIYNGDIVLRVLFVVFICPLALLVALWIYPVTLTALTLLALAHLLRFCKRLAKKFTKHTVDPNAHKEGAEQ